MRIAMATLADAVNVREGMMNVLSGGVTTLGRSEFPAPLGVDLALLLELDERDLEQDGNIDLTVDIVDLQGGSLGSIAGKLAWSRSDVWPQHMPVPMNIRDLMIAEPGRYEVRLRISGLDETVLAFSMSPLESPS